MRCQRCGFDSPLISHHEPCLLCGSVIPESRYTPFKTSIYSDGVPWESNEAIQSPLKAIAQTFIRSFSRHDFFFTAVSQKTEWFGALIYGLLMGSIGTLATVFWEYISPFSISGMLQADGIFISATDSFSPVMLIFTPAVQFFQICSIALYCQTMLWMTGTRKRPLRATFKTVCYIQGASLFQIIPFAGMMVSFCAMVYLLVNGIHATHTISRPKTFLVIALPIILTAILIAVVLLFLILIIAASAGSSFDPFSLFKF
jgi:hypothetical protein